MKALLRCACMATIAVCDQIVTALDARRPHIDAPIPEGYALPEDRLFKCYQPGCTCGDDDRYEPWTDTSEFIGWRLGEAEDLMRQRADDVDR